MSRRAKPASPPSSEALISPKYIAPDVAPTIDEWRALYDAAVRFRDAAPWEWVEEDQIFGVQNAETGEIGYCCIMGQAGEHSALALYRGDAGLLSLRQVQSGELPSSKMEALTAQNCLMASFEDREAIEAPDRQVMQALDLRFRGRQVWPLFRSFLPGSIPWILTRVEARFLTLALEQALRVSGRLNEDKSLLPDPVSPLGPFLVRVRDTGTQGDASDGWRDDILMAQLPSEPEPEPVPVDEAMIARLRSLPSAPAVIEMDMSLVPEPAQENDGERPVFPYMLVVALRPVPKSAKGRRTSPVRPARTRRNEEIGPILAAEPTMPTHAQKRLASLLIELVENSESRPAQIAVRNRITFDSLVRTAQALEIDLSLEDTPSINAALNAMASVLGDPGPSGMDGLQGLLDL